MELVSSVEMVKGSETSIIRFMQSSDEVYKGFGEAYFSLVPCGVERYWKIHKKATCNILVPCGRVVFVVAEYDFSSWRFVELGEEPQKRLTIPPMKWYGFQGLGDAGSIIANIIDIRHQDEEVDAEQKELMLNVPKAKVLWLERTIKDPVLWK